jgi:hypothetical protein
VAGVHGPHLALKALEVVADGHSQGQQFLERLLRLVEGQADPAGLQVDTRRKVTNSYVRT